MPLANYKGTIVLEKDGEWKTFTVHTGGSWAFLFGPFHMFYHKLWLIGIMALGFTIALPILNLLVCIGYVCLAKKLVVNAYIRRGWTVVAHYPDGKIPKTV